ncbi:histidine triad (HIT) family protein [Mesonia algae]|uniref:Histidine triad (HIT) family protein n=1 Tax=Mesonia algae TaxID=213248 RepID=A0A2W7IBU7_9FLAO|nr:HIT family protein [Mesonia algae]PZW43859.1 histidine triad (HIT) family protein [Mesonia algae]
MSTIFTKIINGELPANKVAETDEFLAFLDVNPNAKGHTLCIPKKEVNKLFDLDEETYQNLMKFSRKVALALRKTIPCKRIGMSVVGLEVPHVHVHLIPLQEMDDIRFERKIKMSSDEMEKLAKQIAANF